MNVSLRLRGPRAVRPGASPSLRPRGATYRFLLLTAAAALVFGCGGGGGGGAEDSGSPDPTRDVAEDGAPSFPDVGTVDTALSDTEWPSVKDGFAVDGGDAVTSFPDAGPDTPLWRRDVAPGTRGAPCLENDDCASGWCVAWDEGSVCTELCLTSEGCDEGWECRGILNTLPDTVFACHPAESHLCRPCAADYECGGGFCIELEGELSCTRPCRDGAPCPSGYVCETVTSEQTGTTGQQCVPESGSCTCGPVNVGTRRSCVRRNEFGECWGVEVCDATDGWIDCSAGEPAEEICNGRDDDCDGLADEELAAPETPCRNEVDGVGVCDGEWFCRAAGGWVCTAAVPAPETCDYLDDDCDGETDEDYIDPDSGQYLALEHCGACGRSCIGTLPNATEGCALVEGAPACVVDTCDDGFYALDAFTCLPARSSLCLPCAGEGGCPVPGDLCLELGDARYCGRDCGPDSLHGPDCPEGYDCQELDAGGEPGGETVRQCVPRSGSCECTLDNAGAARPCAVENELGTCYGQEVCDSESGWSACDAAQPAAEVCNGADDDCDGFADEDVVPPVEACETRWTDPDSGETAVCGGDWICATDDGETAWRCLAPEAGPEACNYRDDDCDGFVDEDFRDAESGEYVALEHCGACGASCVGALPNAQARCDGERPGETVRAGCVVERCAPGYYPASDSACVPVQDSSCTPCTDDAGCPVPGDRCFAIDAGLFCARDCAEGNVFGAPAGECGEGYACLPDGDGAGEHCLPATGSCTCLDASDAGSQRSCFRENEHGTCTGLQTCGAEGWSACTATEPAPDLCNGLDDDCDGAVDEDAVAPATPCAVTNEFGTCAADWVCTAEEGVTEWRCAAATPAPEDCNYRDDDCDGDTDEGFRDALSGTYDAYEHCGLCGFSCEGAVLFAAETACEAVGDAARCVAVTCQDGYFRPEGLDTVCVPSGDVTDCSPCGEDAHCEGLPGACVALDGGQFCARDCPTGTECPAGFACSGGQCLPSSASCSCLAGDAGATRPCFRSNVAGTCAGSQTCDPAAGWSSCSAATPRAEVCDGVDDDCDGLVDEDVVPPEDGCERANEQGTCYGSWVCGEDDRGAVGWLCTASTPAAETCNYRDDDCDGDTDETFRDPTSGVYAADEHCGVCGYSCAGQVPGATMSCDSARETPTCVVVACAPGTFQQGDFACLPVTDASCAPCASDDNCPVPGDLCLELDGASYCGRDCGEGNLHGAPAGDCPDGYSCEEVDGVPGARQCVPLSGSCECLAENDGASRACVRANDEGLCYGQETCDPATGWSACSARVPAAEVCNGVDDDCSGVADDVPGLGAPCTVTAALPEGERACEGMFVCVEGQEQPVCGAPTPAVERCNLADDDCDGETDEDWPELYSVCSDGRGACLRYGFYECALGGAGATCNAEVASAGTELCNGVDDDCDGSTDEGWPTLGTVCTEGSGVCERSGVFVCDGATPAAAAVCSVTAGPSGVEVCNALDDDCDGSTDEGWPTLGTVCTEGSGVCERSGVFVCDGATPAAAAVCSVIAGPSGVEVCNALDDDCDGSTDEGWPTLGTVCTEGSGVCERSGVFVCDGATPAAAAVCSVTAGPSGVEVCNALDDDCDGSTDEGWPTLGSVCTEGRGVCERSGVFVCDASSPAGAAVCSATAGPSGVEVCNALDDDCDGSTDEGWPTLGSVCTEGRGVCERSGVFVCDASSPAGAAVCSVTAGPSGVEVCNALDDDCDGSTDEGWATLGTVCTEGRGVCERSGVYVCDSSAPGGAVVCSVTAGASGAEVCNALDDDCDGSTDEELVGAACALQAGVCDGAAEICRGAAGWQPCDASTYTAWDPTYQPTEVACDGRDNDCDGEIDVDLPAALCPLQDGVCAGATRRCGGAAGWLACGAADYGANYETGETRCDLLDNDCDGVTDEGWLAGGVYARDDACGNCFTDCTVIWARDNAYGRCSTAGAPACEMQCCRAGDGNARCDGGAGLSDYFDLNAIPDDGCEFRLDPDAIYVSGGDAAADDVAGCGRGPAGTGTGHRPCATIAGGLAEAVSAGRGTVLVADGVYEETVTLVDGVDLLGGYRADTWERHVSSSLTIVRGAAAGAHRSTVIADGITSATTLQGFVIYGPNNDVYGGNSYGVYVAGSDADLLIADNVIYGGAGGPGADRGVAAGGTAGADGGGRSACAVTAAQEVSLLIPDADVNGNTGTVAVSAAGCTVETLTVDINLTHPDISELVVELVSPAGTVVWLHTQSGAGASSIVGNYDRNLTVDGPGTLADFAGEPMGGTWRLRVIDVVADNVGFLDAWGVRFNGSPYDGFIADDTTPCDASDDRQHANGGALVCDGDDVSGGAGGGNACAPSPGAEASGIDGFDGAAGDGLTGGAAGVGGDAGDDGRNSGATCFVPSDSMSGVGGTNGAEGGDGVAGASCPAAGGLVNGGHWSGFGGSAGGSGANGGGGGGGGAGGGSICSSGCGGLDRLGGHGGGGGSGGCGGAAGQGGTAGGGSFGVFVTGAGAPTVTRTTIVRGQGGDGGDGGGGGTGGTGGRGGDGGVCGAGCWCYRSGGKGGEGGRGGHGGGGGGGCGGVSYGIYAAGVAAAPDYCAAGVGNAISGGAAGAAGSGGASLGSTGADGQSGVLGTCLR